MSAGELLARLRAALCGPLPGRAAHETMLPPQRPYDSPESAGYRPAAVLLLLYPRGASLAFPLILRAPSLGSHRGQVALPGGGIEAGETAEAAALREAREEVGLEPRGVEVLGRLTELPVPPSRYRITPVLAYSPGPPGLAPASPEVAELFEVGLGELLSAELRAEPVRPGGGGSWRVPAYRLGGRIVWGATAMILAELRELLPAAPD